MATIWCLNIKPAAQEGVDPVRFCLDEQILGVGWAVDRDTPLTLDIYYRLGHETYHGDGHKGWSTVINAIGKRMKEKDLCWTRDRHGNYYIGQITGDWEYRSTPDYRRADIVNIRPCKWFKAGGVDSVPGRVLNSFSRGTVKEVPDETVRFYSQLKYNQLSEEAAYDLSSDERLDLFALIDSEDCEDIVGIYLQTQYGYRFIPSSCRRDTVKTEFVLKTAEGKQAYVQVKQGVGLNKDNFRYDANNPCEWFLFTTNGQYLGGGDSHVHCLAPGEMRNFAFDNRELMSDRVQTCIDFCNRYGRRGV